MARNGSGIYSFPVGSWNPAVAGTDINAADWNTLAADLADAVSDSIDAGGTTTITANLPMNGKKHTNVGAASARTQYGQVAQIQDSGYVYAAATDGGTDAYTASLSPAITAYVTGMRVRLKFNERNTTSAPTIALNGISGPKTIIRPTGEALIPGDIDTDGIYDLTYDGTNFQLANPSGDWIPLDDSSVSAAASYIKDSIPASFNRLRVTFSARPATDGATFRLLLRKGAGTDITSYDLNGGFSQGNVWACAFTDGGAVVILAGATENTSPQGICSGEIIINSIQSSDHKGGTSSTGWYDSGTAHFEILVGSFKANDTNPITGVKLLFSSGNIAAGRFRVDGC